MSVESSYWLDNARCKTGVDPEIFFSTEREILDKAVEFCKECLVRTDCQEYALKNRIGHGVWGGLKEDQRRVILRRRATEAATGRGVSPS